MSPSDRHPLQPQPPKGGGTCSCTCLCCGPDSSPSAAWRRSMKRKLDQITEEDEKQQQQQQLEKQQKDTSRDSVSNVSASASYEDADNFHSANISARVEIENEAIVLRETLNSHQKSIQELYEELEQERSAAASAASEAMSMILRLQREKAEAQMEFRQFKRFAEEKMSHDQEEIAVLEDLLFKRDQAVQSLTCEIQAYKHRLMSYGFGPTLSEPQTPDTATALNAAAAAFDYPALRCKIPNDHETEDLATDLDKYAFGETPRDQIQNIEQRIFQMERLPSSSQEKGVVSFSPRRPWHSRRLSADSFGSNSFIIKGEDFPASVDRRSERDDASDRVYTVDAVHCGPESYMSTPRESGRNDSGKDFVVGGGDQEEIKRLYARLQALEADRETMRQTIMSMGTDKAQLVLLKEISQQLCKEVTPPAQPKKIIRKPSFIRAFSIVSAVKWITSFIFWRKKASRTRYTFGISNNNVGLMLLLDKAPRMRQRRSLNRTPR